MNQQTHDIRYVQKKLGHKSIGSTIIYENSEPDMEVKTYVSKVATTDQEKMGLIYRGFESTGILTQEGPPDLEKTSCRT